MTMWCGIISAPRSWRSATATATGRTTRSRSPLHSCRSDPGFRSWVCPKTGRTPGHPASRLRFRGYKANPVDAYLRQGADTMKTIRWVPLAALALAACGDGSGPNRRGTGMIALAVSSQRPTATASASRVLLAGDSTFLMADPDTVILRSVELVARRIKLKPVDVAGCVSDSVEQEHEDSAETDDSLEAEDDSIADEDAEGCEEIRLGPVLVSLPLGTTAVDVL